jgi:hypothetical protein
VGGDALDIVKEVRDSLNQLKKEFEKNYTLFFTEHDIASRAYDLVQKGLNYYKVKGINGETYYLVHHEYPTPFRCDMRKNAFCVKGEDERTQSRGGKQGKKYRRGHYDLVVFNPKFLEKCSFDLAKGQNYDLFKSEISRLIDCIEEPPILIGIEFMYNRVPFPSQKSVNGWYNAVLQDYKKLMVSRNHKNLNGKPFMKEIIMMAFAIGNEERKKQVESHLSKYQEITLCYVEI